MAPAVVAYLRDVAEGRGDQAPSLDAQRAAVERRAEAEGRAVFREYRESDSGALAGWPAMVPAEALAHADAHPAALSTTQLGELARDYPPISHLDEWIFHDSLAANPAERHRLCDRMAERVK